MKFLSLPILVFLLQTAYAEQIDDTKVVATYEVKAGEIAGLSAEHKAIWQGVRAVVAPPLLKLVSKLELFDTVGNAETFTDGYALLNEDMATFTLALSVESARHAFVEKDPDAVPEFQKTIVHEEGHIVSLQESQFDQTGEAGTLTIDEGTLKAGSYLNQFYSRFWKKAFPDRGPEAVSDAEGAALYRKLPGTFVTEYAATGPLEDFAESFAWFVTGPKPSGSAVKDLKVKFFYDWPEMVSLRTQIRQGLASVSSTN